MAKKWKAYPWPDRVDDPQQEEENDPSSVLQEGHGGVQQTAASLEKRQHRHEPVEDEEIDVVGDTDTRQVDHQQTCWGPHSPTAGATAPSPPPLNASGALYYHGEYHAPSLPLPLELISLEEGFVLIKYSTCSLCCYLHPRATPYIHGFHGF